MNSVTDKVLQAVRKDELDLLLMGRWPYFIESAYMAPSATPTNFGDLMDALFTVSQQEPSLSEMLQIALLRIAEDPEGLYCALSVLYNYITTPKDQRQSIELDVPLLEESFREWAASLEPVLRVRREDWMGPTKQTLWDRVDRMAKLVKEDNAKAKA